jgi:hypothetical protein
MEERPLHAGIVKLGLICEKKRDICMGNYDSDRAMNHAHSRIDVSPRDWPAAELASFLAP